MRISIQIGPKHVETCVVTSLKHLKFHAPEKKGDRPWRIVNLETNEVIDSYKPKKPKRPKPTTNWVGSWAEQEARRKAQR